MKQDLISVDKTAEETKDPPSKNVNKQSEIADKTKVDKIEPAKNVPQVKPTLDVKKIEQGDSKPTKNLDTTPELPDGWKKGIDKKSGRVYYVDHNTKTTHWNLPENAGNSSKISQKEITKTQNPQIPKLETVTPAIINQPLQPMVINSPKLDMKPQHQVKPTPKPIEPTTPKPQPENQVNPSSISSQQQPKQVIPKANQSPTETKLPSDTNLAQLSKNTQQPKSTQLSSGTQQKQQPVVGKPSQIIQNGAKPGMQSINPQQPKDVDTKPTPRLQGVNTQQPQQQQPHNLIQPNIPVVKPVLKPTNQPNVPPVVKPVLKPTSQPNIPVVKPVLKPAVNHPDSQTMKKPNIPQTNVKPNMTNVPKTNQTLNLPKQPSLKRSNSSPNLAEGLDNLRANRAKTPIVDRMSKPPR